MSDIRASASTLEAGLLKNAQTLARQALRAGSAQPGALGGLAELCRKAGALEEARLLLERADPAQLDANCRALRAILLGEPAPGTPAESGPSPFVLIPDFLPSGTARDIERLTREALPRFRPSTVVKEGHGYLDPSRRVSWIASASTVSPVFMPFVRVALTAERIPERLGLPPLAVDPHEIQLTCSADGSFFKVHTDHSADTPRRLTFVYYFVLGEKRFTGGDLLLYDQAGAGAYSSIRYTRVPPQPNSIIFFPSRAAHEVEVVRSPTPDLTDGRFTLNGWLRNEVPGPEA